MKLDAILRGNQTLINMERYAGGGTKTYSRFASMSEAALCYQPEEGLASFDLITVHAPKDSIAIFEADPEWNLKSRYLRPNDVIFAIHPETWNSDDLKDCDELRRLPCGEPITVSPTASTRTVLTINEGTAPSHYIKLHYPRRISRFNRRLRRLNVQNSIEVTRDLSQVIFDKFAYLPDVLGFVFGYGNDAFGFLLREAVPRPVQEERFLIPGFALYGQDIRHPEDPPLLVQLIERLGASPLSFVTDEIMSPIIKCWAKVVRERGLLLESHGQNILLEIDQNFTPRRIVHRDMDIWINHNHRRQAGLDISFPGAGIEPNPEQYYSLIYDRYIGHEFFDYFAALLERYYSINQNDIRRRIMKTFHEVFSDADRFFPKKTMFYFSDEPPPGKTYMLVDMKRAPEWR